MENVYRVMKAAKKVIEFRLAGEVLSIDIDEDQIVAKIDEDIYIFFVDWSDEEFLDPEITKKGFEEAFCRFQDVFLEKDIDNISIVPGHIAIWIRGDRAFVRVTGGVELK